jgi:hypothetical protein
MMMHGLANLKLIHVVKISGNKHRVITVMQYCGIILTNWKKHSFLVAMCRTTAFREQVSLTVV